MNINLFLDEVNKLGVDFFTGVPDSQLKALCDTLMYKYGISNKHIVAANEGAAVGLAAGHYLATGHTALVYMQNSGIGNAVNPICSLLNEKVYAIPTLFVIGWRGEPGVKDEPQHVFQGEITIELLEKLKIKTYIIDPCTTIEELRGYFCEVNELLNNGKQCAFVIKKGALETDVKINYSNEYPISREEVVQLITEYTRDGDIYVSTTGKLSRELFEARERKQQGHRYDFLTVGSMGHASMIALGIANSKRNRKVFCLDGDGAILMHMGSMSIIGANQLKNFIHILINNGAHETVGGIPTVSNVVDYPKLASAFGYKVIIKAESKKDIENIFEQMHEMEGPVFIEIKTNLISRKDLGRPTTTPIENKNVFMDYVGSVGE